jgi:hypothetical protein
MFNKIINLKEGHFLFYPSIDFYTLLIDYILIYNSEIEIIKKKIWKYFSGKNKKC